MNHPTPLFAQSCFRAFAFLAVSNLSWLSITNSFAQTDSSKPVVQWSGDFRLRFEEDWDSQNASGVDREDRTRGRVRARVGVQVAFDENWTSGIRLRSGNSRSQQSPHLTFTSDPGSRDDLDGIFDKYYFQYKNTDRTLWIGRNSFPFWQQNEFFWDDDVTPTGVAGSLTTNSGSGNLTTTVGAFALPDGGYGLNGSLFSGQIKYSKLDSTSSNQTTLALGLHNFAGEGGAVELLNNNGMRDYLIGTLGAQWKAAVEGQQITLGIDVFKNFESYTSTETEPFSSEHANEDIGYVLSAQLGQLKASGDWQLGYYYAHIETFSVNASYAQDDWVRFGSSTQTNGSDCSGHEFRFSYGLAQNLSLVSRLFIVDSITSPEEGKRFRIDLNWKL